MAYIAKFMVTSYIRVKLKKTTVLVSFARVLDSFPASPFIDRQKKNLERWRKKEKQNPGVFKVISTGMKHESSAGQNEAKWG